MSWIESLLQFLRQFVPIVVVRDGQQGVRFTRGHATGPYDPNMYWTVPMVWVMEPVNVMERPINLVSLSLTTGDGKTVTCSANINYRIVDAVKASTLIGDHESSMAQEAMKTLHRCGRSVTMEYLLAHQRALEGRVRRSLQRKTVAWGIEVLDVGLTDLVLAKQYRLFMDPPAAR